MREEKTMFDWIKRFFGRSSCRGCAHRRFGGLYCGKRFLRGEKQHFPSSAWQRYGCWYFTESRSVLKKREGGVE